MSIFQGDATFKTMFELGLNDIRKNTWLIDDVLSDFVTNPYLAEKYGQRQIDACKEWFVKNNVAVYMGHIKDREQLPCITISVGNSPEKEEMRHLSDSSTEKVILMPNTIGKPIPFVVKPFTPTDYDISTGTVGIDPDTVGLNIVSSGMILVNPANGHGYTILEVTEEGVVIESGLELDATQLAVVPKYPFYEAKVEHTFFQETYSIGCYAHGDPQVMLWLHSIVLYTLLRYREGMLEASGFMETVVSSSPMGTDDFFTTEGGESAWVRHINITGQVENSWIKAPRRYIETSNLSPLEFPNITIVSE